MTEFIKFASFIDQLISANCQFALWSMPGSHTPELLISPREEMIHPKQPEKLNGEEGFVFAPYMISENAPLILLKPGIYRKGIDEILNIDSVESFRMPEMKDVEKPLSLISKQEYLEKIETIVSRIKDTKLAKVILSRLIPVNRRSESLGEIYVELLQQTPNAFVYLVNLPDTGNGFHKAGTWMGATPEILLKSEGKFLETVSLAGTQSRRIDNNYSWHTKDIEEQAFVSRYLLDVFYKYNIHPYTTQGPETMESGKVAHLSTSFRFAAKKLASNLGDFVADLHPTPAVCGYPKSKAAKFIAQIEPHDRRYYTGYLGPWRMNGEVGLYVNLRCMEIRKEHYILYAGGGITSRSVPEDEWEETNKKATTLLSAIEAVQNR